VDRLALFNQMLDTGLVPLFYESTSETAIQLLEACVEGGAPVLEFTNRGTQALTVFSALREHIEANQLPISLGVGSVVDLPTAALFVAHGADFVVSPTFNEDIARFCNRRKIAYIPGCATATEISTAEEFGAEIVKVFPGSTVGGPAFVKSVIGPMPWSRIMPTGGVDSTQESVRSWIQAGAACVGMGSKLFKKTDIEAQNYDAVAARMSQVISWISASR